MNYYITTRNEFEIVDLDDVIYIKADGNYADIYYKSGKVKTILACLSTFDTNIGSIYQKEKLRNPFYRMGRSYLVNMNYVTSLNLQSQHLSFKCDAVKSVRCTKSLLKRMYNNLLEYHKLPGRKELETTEDDMEVVTANIVRGGGKTLVSNKLQVSHIKSHPQSRDISWKVPTLWVHT